MHDPRSGETIRDSFDYVLVGGGLGNGLIALSLLARRPFVRIAIVECGRTLGGRHRWSFHAGDVPASARDWVEPLIEQRWPRYRVDFPGFTRKLFESYASFSSARFHEVVSAAMQRAPGCVVLTNATAERVGAHEVALADRRVLSAEAVVDGRGPERFRSPVEAAYQKFVGIELEVAESLRIAAPAPTIMDARVPQTDGFRFFYVLPLDEHRLLVEDTYFSSSPVLGVDPVRRAALEYARSMGLSAVREVGLESGVLPLPLRAPPAPPRCGPFLSGFQGGWFHPTTGYSFPLAVRVAEHVAGAPAASLFDERFDRLVVDFGKQARFCAFLNRLLYGCFAPEDRWNVLARFYHLPVKTIRRFYAMNLSAWDRSRILCGRPPRGLSLRHVLTTAQPGRAGRESQWRRPDRQQRRQLDSSGSRHEGASG